MRYEKPRFGGVFLCPLLAVSGPLFYRLFDDLNDRSWGKRTFTMCSQLLDKQPRLTDHIFHLCAPALQFECRLYGRV